MSTTDTTTSGTLPAAWYRDPSGRHQVRWWDGDEWTDRVADGDDISSDPPVRSQPAVTEPDPSPATPAEEAASWAGAEDDWTDEGAGDGEDGPKDPMAADDDRKPDRVPVAERASTAPPAGDSPRRLALVLGILGGAIVIASVLWGMANHRTADQWRDRGEDLQEELVTRSNNADVLEQALGQAASRGARMQDGQAFFDELEEAAVATVDQIDECADDLNLVLSFLASGGGDPTSRIEDANRSCTNAGVNGEGLIALLDQLTRS